MTAENLYQPFEIIYKETDECLKPVHRHNFFELIYIVDGTGRHCINGNKFDYGKGHLFLITPNDTHRLYVTTTTKFFVIRFNDAYLKIQENRSVGNLPEWMARLEFILHHTSRQPGCILTNSSDKLLVNALIEGIIREYVNKEPWHLDIVQQMINTLLAIVARNLYMNLPVKLQSEAGNDDTALKIMHYIQNNIYHPELLKTEQIAAAFSISVNYLGEYFKKHAGESLQQYITHYRLKLVETRLLHSNMRINEIAFELHFTDESHLNRIFKKYRGVSPGEYRRQAKGGMLAAARA